MLEICLTFFRDFLRFVCDLAEISHIRYAGDMTERGLEDKCAMEVSRRNFCKNVTQSLNETSTNFVQTLHA